MALVVEDGTGLSTAESYVSVADADAYHTARGNAAWTGTDTEKEQALRKATEYLDSSYGWIGTLKTKTQALGWPRDRAYDYDGRSLADIVPPKLADATSELALASLSDDLIPILTNEDYIEREKIGSIDVTYRDGAPVMREFNQATRLLKGLYISSAGGDTVKLIRS